MARLLGTTEQRRRRKGSPLFCLFPLGKARMIKFNPSKGVGENGETDGFSSPPLGRKSARKGSPPEIGSEEKPPFSCTRRRRSDLPLPPPPPLTFVVVVSLPFRFPCSPPRRTLSTSIRLTTALLQKTHSPDCDDADDERYPEEKGEEGKSAYPTLIPR